MRVLSFTICGKHLILYVSLEVLIVEIMEIYVIV